MVPGVDSETLDGISYEWITLTSEELLQEVYKPRPVRRVYIPKHNGNLRYAPLGLEALETR